MDGSQPIRRAWIYDVLPEKVRVRCSYQRQGKRIFQYTVQLEIQREGAWRPVVRYDNAHGFCHRDVIHPDGTQDKIAMYIGDANDNFSVAIQELRTNWKAHRDRFLGEIKT